jgi:hypothetical protein
MGIATAIIVRDRRPLLRTHGGRSWKVAVLLLAAVLAAACGENDTGTSRSSGGPQPPHEVRITVSDDRFDMPTQLESEPVSLTLENEGKEVHRAFFARLNDGVTEDEIRAALSKSPDALFPLVVLAGNMPEVKEGDTDEIDMLFPKGNYIVIDPEVKGRPPLQFFEVAAATGPEVREPDADYSIETGEFFFETSDPTSGEATVEIENVGKQGHEVGISDAKGHEVTTIFAPAPGGKLWTSLTLKPGEYTLVCYLPDPKTGKPHIKLGMKKSFTVE